jgi:hypothetical protein
MTCHEGRKDRIVILVTTPVISHEGRNDRIVILVTTPVISHEGRKNRIVILVTTPVLITGVVASITTRSFLPS